MLPLVCSGVLVEIACVGTSEGEIIEVLAQHSNGQRLEILEYYKQSFGQVCYSTHFHSSNHLQRRNGWSKNYWSSQVSFLATKAGD